MRAQVLRPGDKVVLRHGDPKKAGWTGKLPLIALVGNPNVGKSVIFRGLTGRYAVVSNYPGTTVELAIGNTTIHSIRYEVIDTPGANSLTPSSEDERVARDILFDRQDTVVVQIADSKNLDRALMLTCELGELGTPTVLALNMWDELSSRSLYVDVPELRRVLDIPVVRTIATEGFGMHHLREAIPRARVPSIRAPYGDYVTEALAQLEPHIAPLGEKALGVSLMLLAGDQLILRKIAPGLPPKSISEIEQVTAGLQKKLPVPSGYFLTQRRARAVREISGKVVRRTGARAQPRNPVARFLPWALLLLAMFLIGHRAAALVVSLIQAAARRPLPLSWLTWAGGAGMLLLCLLARLKKPDDRASTPGQLLGRLTLWPVSAIPIVIVALWLIYIIVGRFGAGVVVDFVEGKLFGSPIEASGGFDISLPVPFAERSIHFLKVPFDGLNYYLANAMSRVLEPDGFVYRVFMDPDAGLISVGIRYSIAIVFPIVFFFFLAFAVMEDSGYLPRLSLLVDRLFRAMGMNGKAVLPMVLGLGCGAMATLSTRILDTRKERIIATLLLALAIPCSAQLGIIAAVLSQVSWLAVIIYLCVVVSQLFIVGSIASRVIPGRTSSFLIELPPIRRPQIRNVLLKTLLRLRWFVTEAVPLFLVGTLALFLSTEMGLLRLVERLLSPATVGVLGLPAETARGFLLGFLRRDYGAVALFDMFREGTVAPGQIIVALVVITLFVPCLPAFLVIIKERGVRTAFLIMGFIIPYAFAVGAVTRTLVHLVNLHP